MKRIRKLICIVLSIAMLLILPVSAEVDYMRLGDTVVTITYGSGISTTSVSGYTGSSMIGELTVSTTGAFRAVGQPQVSTKYDTQSVSSYGMSCDVSFGYTNPNTPDISYEARSSYSSHSCYVTVVGYWTGSSETNGMNSYVYDEETNTMSIYTVSSSYSVN